jgi:hypothetical protein
LSRESRLPSPRADEVAQEGEGFFVVILIHARQREGQRQLAGLLDRGQLDANAEIIEPIERMAQYRGPRRRSGMAPKKRSHQASWVSMGAGESMTSAMRSALCGFRRTQ